MCVSLKLNLPQSQITHFCNKIRFPQPKTRSESQKTRSESQKTRFESQKTRFFGILVECCWLELRTKKAWSDKGDFAKKVSVLL